MDNRQVIIREISCGGGRFLGMIIKIQLIHKFEDIISLDNLLSAWREFLRGKRNKKDVQEFSLNLMDNIIQLHNELSSNLYNHGGYQSFWVFDPKPRHIHKASVKDRLLHHAIYRILYPFFDRTFASDSFSCRNDKGTHKAMNKFRSFAYQVSQNNTQTCWVLKCDIRKFFDNIDHQILINILKSYIADERIVRLLENIIKSFEKSPGKGLPLGNLTSQLFVNIYMNEFDQFIKHNLKIKHYVRYADDFLALSYIKEPLIELIPKIKEFLENNLKLTLHPNKVFIKTLTSGIDFLGWIHFFDHRVLKTIVKKRIFRRYNKLGVDRPMICYMPMLQSYLGLLRHGNTNIIKSELLRYYDMS